MCLIGAVNLPHQSVQRPDITLCLEIFLQLAWKNYQCNLKIFDRPNEAVAVIQTVSYVIDLHNVLSAWCSKIVDY